MDKIIEMSQFNGNKITFPNEYIFLDITNHVIIIITVCKMLYYPILKGNGKFCQLFGLTETIKTVPSNENGTMI